jgi:hypothetical protein
MVAGLRQNLRRADNLRLWLLGRRVFPWTESPPQRLLVALSRRAHRGRTAYHRAAYMVLSAILKHREVLNADKMNFVATVRAPVSQKVLQNMVAWQRNIRQNSAISPAPRIHGNLCIAGDPDRVQIERFFSLVCTSDVFDNFNIFWDELAAAEALPRTLTKTEQRRAATEDVAFDLNGNPDPDLRAIEGDGFPRAFAVRLEPRRAVTNYLKVAHPRAFVVALSLPEDDDGFSDAALPEWLPPLARFRREFPGVAFCLLNRTMLAQNPLEPPPVDVAPVRSLGFGTQEALALAREADAFIGCLDGFGLAAISARRPGVYFNAVGGDRHDPERLMWWFVKPTVEQCLGPLGILIRQRGPEWMRRS